MNLEEMYLRSPIWLQNLMISGYGYLLRRRRYGPGYGEALAMLRETERLSEDAIRDLQERRLARIIEHAFEHVPYYRDLAMSLGLESRDITLDTLNQALPILEKEQVRAEPGLFVSEQMAGPVLTISTSGTTGSPLSVTCSRSSLRTNYAFFTRFLGWHGITPESRSATFAGRILASQDQQQPPFWRPNPAFNNIQFSSYHLSPGNLPHYATKLESWAPELVDTYPSSGATLANFLNETGQSGRIKPRIVITSSESLFDHQRYSMERAFACPVRDQYGSAEMVSFIAECEYGTMHVAPEYGVVELLIPQSDDSDIGAEIIATGFNNLAMPLIRYRTGDRAIASNAQCDCGRAFPALQRIVGRDDDLIITPEGARIGRLDPIFKGAHGIIECQVVQERIDAVALKAVLAPGFGPETISPVLTQLRLRLPESMSIYSELLPRLQRTPNGKLRAVVSLLPRGTGSK